MMENVVEMILNRDIISRNSFLGAFARNELPKIYNYPASLILNTEPRNSEGEHWLAIYFDKNKNSYFFDSYGQHYNNYNLKSYLEENSKKISYNRKQIQGDSNFCGIYCILFILFISRKKLKSFFQNFYLSPHKNDNLINFFLK